MSDELIIRFAEKADVDTLLSLIQELAEYEKLRHEVVATPQILEESLFGENPKAEALLGFYQDKPVGMAIFFHNFSTFLGRDGIYLEDIYVQPEYRGKGFGKKLLLQVANLAKDRNCGRMEWSVLDWNQPSIDFYKSLGAVPMSDWTVYRLTESALQNLP